MCDERQTVKKTREKEQNGHEFPLSQRSVREKYITVIDRV